MLTLIKNKFSKIDIHTLEVLRKSSSSIVVKVIGMIVGLVVSVFLGRTIGADGLGIINIANKLFLLILVLTMFGMDNVLIKRIAIAFEHKDWQSVGNSIHTSLLINGSVALVLSIFALLFASSISTQIFHSEDLRIPLMITFAMILPQTISRTYSGALSGFRKIWQSNLVNETLSIWIVGLGLLILHLLNYVVDVVAVAFLYALGRMTVTISITTYWKKLFPYSVKKELAAKPMITMAMPLFLVSATGIVASNTDMIMLGWLSNTREVGLYSVAVRIALLVSFFLQVSNKAILPKLATLFSDGKLTEMSLMVKRVTAGLILIAVIFLAVFILGGQLVLRMWGNEFGAAYPILVILGIGQFINISTGCAGLLLIMSGYESIHGYISIASVVMNLLLNYFLIIAYGATGAAMATAITVGAENITKVIVAKAKTGVLTIPFVG